jgi:predicted acylesterase/phospholipase RssA
MKKFIPVLILGICITVSILFLLKEDHHFQETIEQGPRKGVAVILTGAAARIPQEAALLEELDKRGLLKNVVFISGVSSGALNAVMLNGIISKKITWWDYRKILYGIKNSNVFEQYSHSFPLNTSPLRELYTRIFEKRLGYYTIGDLPVTTAISFTNIKKLPLKRTVYRMCSRKINEETDTTLNLVDILMASSAFPIVFQPARIKNATTIPDVEYIDGGVGDDQVPFHALLEFEKHRGIGVEKVYIISRKGDSGPAISQELKGFGIDDDGVFDEINISYDTFLKRGIIKRLEEYAKEAPELVPLTYIWIPEFKEDFLMFNFENLKEQYELTTRWAKTNGPKPLSEYLLPYLLKEK